MKILLCALVVGAVLAIIFSHARLDERTPLIAKNYFYTNSERAPGHVVDLKLGECSAICRGPKSWFRSFAFFNHTAEVVNLGDGSFFLSGRGKYRGIGTLPQKRRPIPVVCRFQEQL